MSQDHREPLRQRLLELHYDLLDASETQSLRRAIENDPDVAEEWQHVQRLAETIADVSRLQALPLVANTTVTRPTPNESVELTTKVSRASAWKWSTAIAATAAMLGWLSIGSLYFARIPAAPQAALRVQASPIPEPLARSDHEFLVRTSAIDRTASGAFSVTPASLSFTVLARGDILFSGSARTDDEGNARISLPRELLVPPEAKLQLTARVAKGSAEKAGAANGSVASSSFELPLQPTRCATYLTTDRPIYRPGERIFFRSLTLLRSSLTAASEFPVRFKLIDPNGELVAGASLEGVTRHGVGNGAFMIPRDALAGVYSLSVTSLDGLFPEQRCRVEVRHFRTPRFTQQVRFSERGYAPGDRVEAQLQIARVTGEPWGKVAVRVSAWVDDRAVHDATVMTTDEGVASIAFTLPKSMGQRQAHLSVTLPDRGETETHEIELPLQQGEIAVQFYPEGGDLVEGLQNRVYVTAVDDVGQPVSLSGRLIDGSGNLVASVVTSRDGMGRFGFRPERGQSYRLEVASSPDRTLMVPLPVAVANLPVLDAGTGVFAADQPIQLTVRSDRSRSLRIRAMCRGRVVSEETVEVTAGDQKVELPIDSDASGVIRLTLLDAQSRPARPLMERLVFRRSSKQLRIEFQGQTGVIQRAPGESLSMMLQVLDETENPLAAVLGVSVVDQAVLGLDQIDRPSMNTQLLLLSEIESPERLEQADFYLSDDPEAAVALDLLLGTQGWRRFLSPALAESNENFREQLVRLLELDGDPSTESTSFDNGNSLAVQWSRYQQTIDQAWKRMWMEVRFLLVLVAAIWLLVWMIYRRRSARPAVAASLLIAFATVWIEGCGVQAPTSRVATAAVESQAPAAAADAADTDPTSDTHARDVAVADGERSADATERVERDPSLEYLDWLDEARVAWLLRITQAGDGQSSADATDGSAQGPPAALTREALQHLMKARGRSAEEFADEIIQALQFPVRQYAHRRSAKQFDGDSDLAESLFWHPLLVTDAQGQATIEFDLPDSVTTFRMQVDGHGANGRIGSASATIQTPPR